MGSYTITFTPDDVSNASAVVRVDLGAAGARITELTVRAGNGDGLVPGELPGFDLGRLLRAIAPAGPTTPAFELSAAPVASAAANGSYESEPAVAAPPKRTAKRTAAKRATASRGASDRTAGRATATGAAAKKTAAKQAAAKTTATAAGGGRGARKAAAGSAPRPGAAGSGRTTARTGAAAARTTRAAQSTGRAYRRTPEDIVAVFTQAPSATALARHYGVPRHTVQGWLRRLRAEGVLPPSSRATA